MLFNSVSFLFFFTLAIVFYFSIPYRFRWAWLLSASYYFYISWKPGYVILILLTTLITYYAGIQMGKRELKNGRKRILILALAFNIGLLFFFKYFEFMNESLRGILGHFQLSSPIPVFHFIIPIGISFYIFKSLSYAIDVYRGDVKPERHLGFFALYVSFFPQLLAGPIERATRFLPQLYQKLNFDEERVTHGLRRMLWGFFQKMVIADNLAVLVDPVFNLPSEHSGLVLIMATLFYTFQIYCDFSGYSDIAIGAAQVMGFTTLENFNRPYFSQSIPEFWRRWHISLSSWFRDYCYIPIGGNRVSIPRWYFNLFVVLLICGLWHGANWTFVAWGAIHGFYLVLSAATQPIRKNICQTIGLDRCPRLHRCLKTGVTFLLVSFAWIFFRANSLSDALSILSRLSAGWGDLAHFSLSKSIPLWNPLRIELIVGVFSICLLIMVESMQNRGGFTQMFSEKPAWIRWPIYYFILLSILLLGHFGTKQFIYFQF